LWRLLTGGTKLERTMAVMLKKEMPSFENLNLGFFQ
jgi:hypothetical protein